jgi:hypothetical protein
MVFLFFLLWIFILTEPPLSPSFHPQSLMSAFAAFLRPIVLLTAGVASTQEKIDLDAAHRIRDAALNHSQIMEMAGYLTDVTGSRLTGSPNLKRAEKYARNRLRDWGLENAHLRS